MSSHHDDVNDFWGGQHDWTDSQPRQRNTGRTRLAARLKTGVQSVFDAGATGARVHGESGDTPVVEPAAAVPGDLDFDLTPQSEPARRKGDGLSIGELAQPWDSAVHEATQPVRRVSVGVMTPPSTASVEAGETLDVEAALEDDPAPSDDYSGLAAEAEPWDAEWAPETKASPRHGVDPLLAKFGLLAVVLTLGISVLVSMGDDDGDTIATDDTATTLATGADTTPKKQGSAGASKQGSAGASKQTKQSEPAARANGAGAATAVVAEKATVAEETVAEPVCATEYDVVDGDYWLRLADGSGVSLNKLLKANGASTDTPLYPGSTICLPEGAATPPPPPPPSTAAPKKESSKGSSKTNPSSGGSSSGSGSPDSGSAAAPAAPAPASTAPPSTAPPSTAPPTTQAPTPAAPAEVERIIRKIWPDHLEEKALSIAWRESNHRPDVNNYCCYGLFQIYFSVHQSWLADLGINQAEHLFDARLNTIAAYTLYQQAGGWGPWGG